MEDDFRPTSLLAAVMQQQQQQRRSTATTSSSKAAARRRGEMQQQVSATKPKAGPVLAPGVTVNGAASNVEGGGRGYLSAQTVSQELSKVHGGRVTIRYRMAELLLYIVNALKTNGSTVELRFTNWGLTTERVNRLEGDATKYQVCTVARLHSSWFHYYACEGTVSAVVSLSSLATILTQFKRGLHVQYIELTADNNSMWVKGAVSADPAVTGDVFGLELTYVQDAKQRHSYDFLPVTQYPHSVQCSSAALLAKLNAFAAIMQVPDSQMSLLNIRLYLNPQRLFFNEVSKTGAVRSFGIEVACAAPPPPPTPPGSLPLTTAAALSTPSVPSDGLVLTPAADNMREEKTPSQVDVDSKQGEDDDDVEAPPAKRSASSYREMHHLDPFDPTNMDREQQTVHRAGTLLPAAHEVAAVAFAQRGRSRVGKVKGAGGTKRKATTGRRASAAKDKESLLPDGITNSASPMSATQSLSNNKKTDEPEALLPLPPIAPVMRFSDSEQAAMGEYIDLVVDQREMLNAMSNPKMNRVCSLYFRNATPLAIRFVVGAPEEIHLSKSSVVDAYVPLKDAIASDALSGFDQHVSSIM